MQLSRKGTCVFCANYFRLLPKYYFSNHHFLLLVKNVLLRCGCVETNPGPQIHVHRKNVSIVNNNVCSLLPKIDTINNELSGNDIIAITETHLDDSICDERLFLNGYHPPLRKDRNRFGGGVALYISKHLKYVIRNDLCRSDIEIFWCEIHTSSDKFLVGVI